MLTWRIHFMPWQNAVTYYAANKKIYESEKRKVNSLWVRINCNVSDHLLNFDFAMNNDFQYDHPQ